MVRTSNAKPDAIAAMERLLRAKGYHATGLTEILEVSGAPKGSFYFHFPEGKRQLAQEALEAYAARVAAQLKALSQRFSGDSEGFIRALCAVSAAEMEASGWELGCAVQNTINESAGMEEALASTTCKALELWMQTIADALEPTLGRDKAQTMATTLIAALEGARTVAKALKTPAPFQAVSEVLVLALRSSR